jgi:hypothetical protein
MTKRGCLVFSLWHPHVVTWAWGLLHAIFAEIKEHLAAQCASAWRAVMREPALRTIVLISFHLPARAGLREWLHGYDRRCGGSPLLKFKPAQVWEMGLKKEATHGMPRKLAVRCGWQTALVWCWGHTCCDTFSLRFTLRDVRIVRNVHIARAYSTRPASSIGKLPNNFASAFQLGADLIFLSGRGNTQRPNA